MQKLIIVLSIVALLLCACRFTLVESDSVTIAASTAVPESGDGAP